MTTEVITVEIRLATVAMAVWRPGAGVTALEVMAGATAAFAFWMIAGTDSVAAGAAVTEDAAGAGAGAVAGALVEASAATVVMARESLLDFVGVAAAGLGVRSVRCCGVDAAESFPRRGVGSAPATATGVESGAPASAEPRPVPDADCDGVESAGRAPRFECARGPGVLESSSTRAWVPLEEPGEVSDVGSAHAMPGPVKIAAPTPSAAAKPPIRPMYLDGPIALPFL